MIAIYKIYYTVGRRRKRDLGVFTGSLQDALDKCESWGGKPREVYETAGYLGPDDLLIIPVGVGERLVWSEGEVVS